MDGTRLRRTSDPARLRWYSRWRAVRFARHFGFAGAEPKATLRSLPSAAQRLRG